MESLSSFELASEAVAVMVWVPSESALLMLAPVPCDPSMLDTHAIELERLPSSRSLAVPVKLIDEPES
jgi:hypothetical protein